MPLVSLVLGVLAALGIDQSFPQQHLPITLTILSGLAIGLGASGGWSSAKALLGT